MQEKNKTMATLLQRPLRSRLSAGDILPDILVLLALSTLTVLLLT